MINTNDSLEEYIVAFIDVLGSTENIKSNSKKSLEIMNEAYSESIKMLERIHEGKIIKPEVKIFSDNIVVAMPRNGVLEQAAFLSVIMMSAIIQVAFLKRELLTRGGIASGDFFIDDMMVWGNALIKAHELESSIAVYPRVVIEPKLIGQLGLASEDCKHKSKEWMLQDEDGFFVVDYINRFLKNQNMFTFGLLDVVDEKVACNLDKLKVCQKWNWLSTYLVNKIATMKE